MNGSFNGFSFRVLIQPVDGTHPGDNRTVATLYNALFLGGADRLLQVMNATFPELGLTISDSKEMSWIDSALYFEGFPEILLEGKSGDSTRTTLLFQGEFQQTRRRQDKVRS
ncbi:hypothetical protein M569_01437 [Genlisea aurea]|uniref:Uncharacterized protein n=1 Tax=Genlisea aurea TaxID=192259 RepID=S8EBM2_9LAMI|nr:hypothetical protein M569_01437 [Genlisea aurea]